MFRRGSNSTNDFTILFDVPNGNDMTTANINSNNINATTEEEFMSDPYTYYSSSSSSCSSPVDCTLSLGPASSRQSTRITGSSTSVPKIYWDVRSRSKQSKQSPSSPCNNGSIGRGGGGGGGGSAAVADFLLPRRCANCDTTSTPLWRNGPRGPKSLCNACGIRYKKEERLAAAATAIGGGAPATVHVNPWTAAYQPVMSGGNGAIRKNNAQQTSSMSDEHTPIPYYSWCL